jgi:hypothetical protein
VRHLDWAANGRMIQSNAANELLYWSVKKPSERGGAAGPDGGYANVAAQYTHAIKLRDKRWASWTCVFGWGTRGVWDRDMDADAVHTLHQAHAGDVLVTSDNSYRVRLMKWPCLPTTNVRQRPYRESAGHCTQVTSARFSADDGRVVTVGGKDCSVFVWAHRDEDGDRVENDVGAVGPASGRGFKVEFGTEAEADAIAEEEMDDDRRVYAHDVMKRRREHTYGRTRRAMKIKRDEDGKIERVVEGRQLRFFPGDDER